MSTDINMDLRGGDEPYINVDFYRKIVKTYLELVSNKLNMMKFFFYFNLMSFNYRIGIKRHSFGPKRWLLCQEKKNKMYIG